MPEGNAGHFAAMFNIDAKNANSILHFDYDGYHLTRSDRINGKWVTHSFQKGWSPLNAGDLPGMNIVPCRSQTTSLYSCVGGMLSIDGEKAILEPDSRETGLYYERSSDGRIFRLIDNQIQVKHDDQWERVATLPIEFDDQAVFGTGASNVFVVGTEPVFFAEHMGDRIRLHEFDGQNWRAEDWHLGDWDYAYLNVRANDQPMLHVLETKTSSGFSSLQVYSRE